MLKVKDWAMAGRTLPTTGLPGPTVAHGTAIEGRFIRYVLPQGASVIDPLDTPFHPEEPNCLRTTEISKMKGQGLVGGPNAKLIAVNLRYIAYAMKEGTVRIINQNGKDLFKLHNTTKAVITDMAINGTGQTDQGTTVLCVDAASHVSVFVLEAYSGKDLTSEERTKKVELVFPSNADPPVRILAHPTDSQLFVTMHASRLGVWSLALLDSKDPRELGERRWSESHGFVTHDADSRLIAKASVQFDLPQSDELNVARLCDAAVSVDAKCLIALAEGTVFVWRMESPGGPRCEPELLQKLKLGAHGCGDLHCLRTLGGVSSQVRIADHGQVLVIASVTGCDLFAYHLAPSTTSPVGALLQSIRIVSSKGDDLVACIDANHIAHDSLGIAFRHKTLVLVLPLALQWSDRMCSPFPYAQRFVTEEPANQLSIMSGKSYQNAGYTLFMYRAHNFTREKDNLLGCDIAVSEVDDRRLVQREEALSGDAAAGEQVPAAAASLTSALLAAHTAATAESGRGPAEEEAVEKPPGLVASSPATRGEEVAEKPPGLVANGPPSRGEEAGFLKAEDMPPGLVANGPAPRGKEAGLLKVPNGGGVESPPAVDLEEAAAVVVADSPEAQDTEPPAWIDRLPESAPDASAAAEAECEEGDVAAAPRGAAAASSTDAGAQELGAGGSLPSAAERSGADVDWAFVKHIAASFVKGLDKKRGEMAHRLLKEIAEAAAKEGAAGAASDVDAAVLDQALGSVREARDATAASEKNLQVAARKAAEMWMEASAQAVGGVLQKELGKISDGVAATLAQQLSQSRKFCEALAKGVHKSGGVATKQALEALRPPKQLQETVGNALTDALQESLTPVFKSELRQHFETELAPLIGMRIGELMASFRDSMSKVLDSISSEHELAGQRLGRELAPVVASELRQVQQIVEQRRPPASSGEFSEAQLDELAQAVQVEIVQPLHSRIQDLTSQVETLREETRRLEERWQSAQREQATARSRPSADEETQARELEGLFNEGKVTDAFIKAMHLQVDTARCDLLGRLCSLVPEGGLEDWLAGDGEGAGPLSMQLKMLLMLSLARQLEGAELSDEARSQKIEWITELWFAFDPAESSVAENARVVLAQLTEALDSIQLGGCSGETAAQLRKLKKAVQQYAKILRDKS